MTPRVLVACPVAHREWVLPDWYRHLAAQTVKPSQVMLVHGGEIGDPTWRTIGDCARNYGLQTLRLHDTMPTHPRQDNTRFHTLTLLRNKMLAWASITGDHDYLLSLDSDILCEDPHTIERLLATLTTSGEYDIASPLLSFHPDASWTANGGLLGRDEYHPRVAIEAGRPEDLGTWPWRRAVPWRREEPQPIDIPMGASMMTRRAYSTVRYRWHESGEDIGFAINLRLAGLRACWLTNLEVRHVWSRDRL